MNRRTFLAGLATTTAIVAAGGAPAPRPLCEMTRGTIEGVKFILDDEWVRHRPAHQYIRIPYIGTAKPNAAWVETVDLNEVINMLARNRVKPLPDGSYCVMAQPTREDDRRLYGVAFQRLPGGERIDPRDVYAEPA